MTKRRKGLSPVIATVLLIGMVVVMGLIIFTWFRGLTQEAVLKFDENVQLVCNDVQFTGTYLSSDGMLSISNSGNVPIYNLMAKVQKAGSYETVNLKDSIFSEKATVA